MTEQLTPVYPERFLRRACQNGALVSPSISPLRLSTADSQLSTFCPNSFRFTHFRKNGSATPLVSHTFKTKDLKPFRFTHFQKKGGGSPLPLGADLGSRAHYASPDSSGPVTNHKSLRLSPLTSALTSKRAAKSFRCNTYEKHTQGEGALPSFEFRVSNFDSLVTSHATEVS